MKVKLIWTSYGDYDGTIHFTSDLPWIQVTKEEYELLINSPFLFADEEGRTPLIISDFVPKYPTAESLLIDVQKQLTKIREERATREEREKIKQKKEKDRLKQKELKKLAELEEKYRVKSSELVPVSKK